MVKLAFPFYQLVTNFLYLSIQKGFLDTFDMIQITSCSSQIETCKKTPIRKVCFDGWNE